MRENHPIEGLMRTTMSSIREMIDVNTIVGETIKVSDQISIIPISKVSFGFAAGGSEFKGEAIGEYSKRDKDEEIQYTLPFGGGTGAGVSIHPVAFLIVQNDLIKLIPVEHISCIDRILDYAPDIIETINSIIEKNMQGKAERTEKLINQIKKTSKEIFDKEKEKEKEEIKKNQEVSQN